MSISTKSAKIFNILEKESRSWKSENLPKKPVLVRIRTSWFKKRSQQSLTLPTCTQDTSFLDCLFKVYTEKIIIIIKHSRQCLIHDIKFANTLKCIRNTLQCIIIATLILAIRNLIKQGLLCLIYLGSLFHLLCFPKSAQNILTNVIYF